MTQVPVYGSGGVMCAAGVVSGAGVVMCVAGLWHSWKAALVVDCAFRYVPVEQVVSTNHRQLTQNHRQLMREVRINVR